MAKMENEKIQNFLLSNGKYLPMNEIGVLSKKLQLIEYDNFIFKLYAISFKNPTTFTLLYWLCPGFAFIDRFFVGSYILGLLKIFMPLIISVIYLKYSMLEDYNSSWLFLTTTLALFGFSLYILWILIDGFTIGNRIKSYNLSKIYELTTDMKSKNR